MAIKLQDLLAPSRIKRRLEAEDKGEVFEELVDLLVTQYGLDSRDAILDAIRRREEKMSTGIKRGIAIPHAKTPFTKGVIGVLGISEHGIDYESLDGEPVHLLFLLVSSEEDAGSHLSVLKKIALLVENPDFYAEVLKAADPEQVSKVIRKYEEILDSQDA
ncbi:MAG: PTS sugar transporter subunit IIA [Spirochaetes bacterium]|nr:PTS sugar transporter subunit IIA [Spirochaetota bacterium]